MNNNTLDKKVFVSNIKGYDKEKIIALLPDQLFDIIKPGYKVVIKPNWVLQCHESKPNEWEQVITNPDIITAIIEKTIGLLKKQGHIFILDGPELNADFDKILKQFPVDYWKNLAKENGVILEIIDLRDEQYIQDGNVTTSKKKLNGDPLGKVIVNLEGDFSEFYNHKKSVMGYYGAGPDIIEVNNAHNGQTNLYSISKTVMQADVFINVPKLKTHKKAGITASLKNLVGINTYRNYLPHYSLGADSAGGDQFMKAGTKNKIESRVVSYIKQHFLITTRYSRLLSPLFSLGKYIFGDNEKTIRGGSWYGNDTLWRTILDINKILFYGSVDGHINESLKRNSIKYITIVDGIMAGEGSGPKKPYPVNLNYIFCGSNPVSVDAVCASFMGFNPDKIPTIQNAFKIKKLPLVDFSLNEITIKEGEIEFDIKNIPANYVHKCKPHFGWVGHIESF